MVDLLEAGGAGTPILGSLGCGRLGAKVQEARLAPFFRRRGCRRPALVPAHESGQRRPEAPPCEGPGAPVGSAAPTQGPSMAETKFSQFIAAKKLDPRRILAASDDIEKLRPEDRIIKLNKRRARSAEAAEGAAEGDAKAALRASRDASRLGCRRAGREAERSDEDALAACRQSPARAEEAGEGRPASALLIGPSATRLGRSR